jgi:hypothetical protein
VERLNTLQAQRNIQNIVFGPLDSRRFGPGKSCGVEVNDISFYRYEIRVHLGM